MTTKRKRRPTHPGEMLKKHYYNPLGLSVSEIARILGVSRGAVSNLLSCKTPVSAQMALRLSKAFNTSPELWMNMQMAYDLWVAMHSSSDWKKVEKAEKLAA